MNNRLQSLWDLTCFRQANADFIVSTREITPDVSIMDYLKLRYLYLRSEQIVQVFGFLNSFSPLYGGRGFQAYHGLTPQHCDELAAHGIGIGLNLTNHLFDKQAYASSLDLLERHHRPDNAIMVTNDELARQLRQDFPRYILKASVIKNISTLSAIEKALALYDQLTLPMDLNDDDDFLASIPCKERIILFANASCAYTCPKRSCYLGISQKNRGEAITSTCSKGEVPRPDYGLVYFNVEKFVELGFSRFKLIPDKRSPATSAATRFFSWKRGLGAQAATVAYKKPLAIVASYPKSGRTWLRFILANYFNDIYKLGMQPDLHNFFSLLPNDTDDADKGLAGFGYYQHDDVPLLPFSHNNYVVTSSHPRTILLLRSPLAVMVSDYYQQRDHLRVYEGNLSQFIRDPHRGIDRYCRYLNGWAAAAQGHSYFVLSYEQLSADPQQTVTDLLHYLEQDVNGAMLAIAIESANFDKMQRLEEQQGLKAPDYDRSDVNARRMRKGCIDSYRSELTEADQQWLCNVLIRKLKPEAMALLEQHGCFFTSQTERKSCEKL